MPGAVETLSTFNSLVRTFLAVVILGLVAGGGWLGYRTIEAGSRAALEATRQQLAERDRLLAERDREIQAQAAAIARLEQDVRETRQRLAQAQTALRLLKVEKRVARLTVVDQASDPRTGELRSTVEFVELDERQEPIGEPRTFTIEGNVVYVDNWIVKFDDRYVESADELRGASLVLFRRIFGEHQQPDDGFVLDRAGDSPGAYMGGEPLSELEATIWSDFWTIANDPARAARLGIRAAHGEAVSMRLEKGRSYRLVLRAADGLSIIPDADGSL